MEDDGEKNHSSISCTSQNSFELDSPSIYPKLVLQLPTNKRAFSEPRIDYSAETSLTGINDAARVYQGLGVGCPGMVRPSFDARSVDSDPSSMEYWDYSVELEMLKDQNNLQLAAELGKTLLERNKVLDLQLQQQNVRCEDHRQEIEYLSKQTAALREVNESRLLIYEKLEITLADLEQGNNKLSAEGANDRRKIKSLSAMVDALEQRNEELSRQLEARLPSPPDAASPDPQGRALVQEAVSSALTPQQDEKQQELIDGLRAQLASYEHSLYEEAMRREHLEQERSTLLQEQESLRGEVCGLEERLQSQGSLQQELRSAGQGQACPKCSSSFADTGSLCSEDSVCEDFEEDSKDSRHNVLVRLSNGLVAYGSQDSLASTGMVVQSPHSPTEVPKDSLHSELNSQYQALIDKYEKIAQDSRQREQMLLQQIEQQMQQQPSAEMLSGPVSLMISEPPHISEPPRNPHISEPPHKCQRCSHCTCAIASDGKRPKSSVEDYSEAETSSSGFSDGEVRFINRLTQTEGLLDFNPENCGTTEELAVSLARYLDMKSPNNPCEQRFQSAPEYKKLFHEIFTVLKETVDEDENKNSTAANKEEEISPRTRSSIDGSEISVASKDSQSTTTAFTENDSVCSTPYTDRKQSDESAANVSTLLQNVSDVLGSDKMEISGEDRPLRPRSLDLISNQTSRSSSKNRKRREREMRKQMILQEARQKAAEKREQKEQNKSTEEPSPAPSPSTVRHSSRRGKYCRNRSRSSSKTPQIQPQKQAPEPVKVVPMKEVVAQSSGQIEKAPQHNDRIIKISQTVKSNTVASNLVSGKPPRNKARTVKKQQQQRDYNVEILNKSVSDTRKFVDKYCRGGNDRTRRSSNYKEESRDGRVFREESRERRVFREELNPLKPALPVREEYKSNLPPPGPVSSASAMVAQLRGLENTYAQVLKTPYRKQR